MILDERTVDHSYYMGELYSICTIGGKRNQKNESVRIRKIAA